MYETILKNWKTSLGGLLLLAILALKALGYITDEQAATLVTAITAFGLIGAADGSLLSQLIAFIKQDIDIKNPQK